MTSTSTSVSGWSPSVHGHHSRGSLTSRVQSTSLRPAGERLLVLVEQHAVDAGADTHRACGVAVEPGVQAQVGPGVVGVAAQHPAAVDAHRPGRRRSAPAATARRGSSRVDRVPVLEDAGDVRASTVRLRCGGQATSTASTCSVGEPRRGSVMSKRVREEVALGVAEVGAVEPHVGLVEDAVEGHEATPPVRRAASRWKRVR